MSDGMPTMTHRTTFALDDATALRLKRLAARWGVSQAEVVRRAVAHSEQAEESPKPDRLSMLKAYHAKGGMKPERADQWIREIEEDRKHWRTSS
jgi:predicted transcriptional regulator